ncbi:MAG: type II toxin-antitoxin system HicA family toxin [Saprospiraceae bacterium]|nr:type II toxin-antitoxin system HicA family toxin [Saprospiraceae bacterium]
MDAKEVERLLLKAGFYLKRIKGSHRIYFKESTRIVIPFHAGKSLHPKIVIEVFELIKSIED